MASHYIYRFYAELEDYTPKIWRRFEITGSKTIAELGYALMTMFEMKASHLFCFTYDRRAHVLDKMRHEFPEDDFKHLLDSDYADALKTWRVELPFADSEEYENEQLVDASQCKLKEISTSLPLQLDFEYDYGDSWRVHLELESCEKIEIHASKFPRVIDGQGYGIIEDCGGVYGLAELTEAFKAQSGEQYDEFSAWLGIEELDLDSFDIEDMNFRLKKVPRIYKEIYEYGNAPTKRSIDLLERKYIK